MNSNGSSSNEKLKGLNDADENDNQTELDIEDDSGTELDIEDDSGTELDNSSDKNDNEEPQLAIPENVHSNNKNKISKEKEPNDEIVITEGVSKVNIFIKESFIKLVR